MLAVEIILPRCVCSVHKDMAGTGVMAIVRGMALSVFEKVCNSILCNYRMCRVSVLIENSVLPIMHRNVIWEFDRFCL